MNTHYACFVRPAVAAICVASLATLVACGGNTCISLGGCVSGNSVPDVTLSGTAATGKALASAAVSVSCAQGSGSTLSDGGGHYTLTFNAALPCIWSAAKPNWPDMTLAALKFSMRTKLNFTPP